MPYTLTLAELSRTGFDAVWVGVVAPRDLPAPADTRLSKELAVVMALPEVRDNYELGRTVNTGMPEAIAAAIRQDVPRWREIVREAQTSENR